jgi:hypothetical protein
MMVLTIAGLALAGDKRTAVADSVEGSLDLAH